METAAVQTPPRPGKVSVVFLLPLSSGWWAVAASHRRNKPPVILWRARLAAGIGDDPIPETRKFIGRQGLAPGTPVSLVTPPGVGGFVKLGVTRQRRSKEEIDAYIQTHLPYPPGELLWRTAGRKGEGAELFWVPREFAARFNGALAEVGLNLTEIIPRAALVRRNSSMRGTVTCVLETFAAGTQIHRLEGSSILSSLYVANDSVELFSASVSGDLADSASRLRVNLDLEDREFLDSLYDIHEGAVEGLQLVKDHKKLLRPLLKVLGFSAIGVLLVLTALDYWSQNMASALAEEKRLLRQLRRDSAELGELQAHIEPRQRLLEIAKQFNNLDSGLEIALEASSQLPAGVWVHQIEVFAASARLQCEGSTSAKIATQFEKLPARYRVSASDHPTGIATPCALDISLRVPKSDSESKS